MDFAVGGLALGGVVVRDASSRLTSESLCAPDYTYTLVRARRSSCYFALAFPQY